MPCNANGLRQPYLLQRLGDGPTLMLSNSLGGTSTCNRLTEAFHVLRYDKRGQGACEVTGRDDTIELRPRTIPASRLVSLETSHVSNVERPGAFSDALLGFMAAQAGVA